MMPMSLKGRRIAAKSTSGGSLSWAAFERTERRENNPLELPHKTLTRQGANQFTHFQREQRAG